FYEGLIEVEDVHLTTLSRPLPGCPTSPERAIPEPADRYWSEIRVRLRCCRALMKFRIASSKALFLDSLSLAAVASNSVAQRRRLGLPVALACARGASGRDLSRHPPDDPPLWAYIAAVPGHRQAGAVVIRASRRPSHQRQYVPGHACRFCPHSDAPLPWLS